ncbi:MAG: protein kinase family protein [Balneolaceae bacterium]
MSIDKIIEFLRKKDFLLKEYLGQGGTGKTALLYDQIIDELFVCKKYSPYYEDDQEKYYDNFIDEIKILHKIYHSNVVRVFNYYLYPCQVTGYIIMEFIDGVDITSYLKNNPDRFQSLFLQAIEGFKYLEENGILHRDIRPENMLVTNDGVLKIIDFGFGKVSEIEKENIKSISLNWRYTIPSEFSNSLYDHRSDVYFIGKLFEEIRNELQIQNFRFDSILKEMVKHDYSKRSSSFFEVWRKITSNTESITNFTWQEKEAYRSFAKSLTDILTKIEVDTEYERDTDRIIRNLDQVLLNSSLENEIQHPVKIASCFLNGSYRFVKSKKVKVDDLKSFLNFFKNLNIDRKKIVLNNIWERLDTIERYEDDHLPF